MVGVGVDAYREFLELSRCLNFTQAAQNLNETQPALSKHIAALEQEFGTALFHRNRRSVELTEAGRAMCSYATSIVSAYDGAAAAIAQIVANQPVRVDGVLLDGTVSAIVSIAALLAEQEGLAPLSIAHREDVSPLDQLADNEIDLALTGIGSDQIAALDMVSRPLIEVPFVAVFNRDHPLAGRSSLRMEELADEKFVHFVDPYASAAWEDIAACCRRHGFEPKTWPVMGSTSTYTTMHAGGTVLVQQSNLRQLRLLEESGVASVVPVSDQDACFRIGCVVRRADAAQLERHLAAFEKAGRRATGRAR